MTTEAATADVALENDEPVGEVIVEVATPGRAGKMGHDDFAAHRAMVSNDVGIIIITDTKLISRKTVPKANGGEALEFELLHHDMSEDRPIRSTHPAYVPTRLVEMRKRYGKQDRRRTNGLRV